MGDLASKYGGTAIEEAPANQKARSISSLASKYGGTPIQATDMTPGSSPDNPIDEQVPDLGRFDRMGLMNLTASSGHATKIIRDRFGLPAVDRGNYDISIQSNKDNKWYVLDPKRFEPIADVTDVLGGTFNTIVSIFGGLGGAALGTPEAPGVGTVTGAMLGAGGAGAAEEATRVALGGMIYGEQPTAKEALTGALTQGAIGATGEGLGRAIGPVYNFLKSPARKGEEAVARGFQAAEKILPKTAEQAAARTAIPEIAGQAVTQTAKLPQDPMLTLAQGYMKPSRPLALEFATDIIDPAYGVTAEDLRKLPGLMTVLKDSLGKDSPEFLNTSSFSMDYRHNFLNRLARKPPEELMKIAEEYQQRLGAYMLGSEEFSDLSQVGKEAAAKLLRGTAQEPEKQIVREALMNKLTGVAGPSTTFMGWLRGGAGLGAGLRGAGSWIQREINPIARTLSGPGGGGSLGLGLRGIGSLVQAGQRLGPTIAKSLFDIPPQTLGVLARKAPPAIRIMLEKAIEAYNQGGPEVYQKILARLASMGPIQTWIQNQDIAEAGSTIPAGS